MLAFRGFSFSVITCFIFLILLSVILKKV